MTCLTQRVLASSALTCFTVQLRRRFCWRRSSTRPATMSDGTTSRSRKNSVNSRATSSNEFCKHDVIMSRGGSGSKRCDSAVVYSTWLYYSRDCCLRSRSRRGSDSVDPTTARTHAAPSCTQTTQHITPQPVFVFYADSYHFKCRSEILGSENNGDY